MKNGKMDKFIPSGKAMAIRTLYSKVKILPKISRLKFWYPSVTFGHERA